MIRFLTILSAASLAIVPVNSAYAETPEQNLDCAIWTSVMMDQETDEEVINGLGFVLTWFIGLYEGATGKQIDDAMVARSRTMTDDGFQALNDVCLARMTRFGVRLEEVAGRLELQGN